MKTILTLFVLCSLWVSIQAPQYHSDLFMWMMYRQVICSGLEHGYIAACNECHYWNQILSHQ